MATGFERSASVASLSREIQAAGNHEVLLSQFKVLVDAGDHEGAASTIQAAYMVVASNGDFSGASALKLSAAHLTCRSDARVALPDDVDSDSLLAARCKAFADAGDYAAAAALKLKSSSTRTNSAAAADVSSEAACTAAAQRDALLVARCKRIANSKLQATRSQSSNAALTVKSEQFATATNSASVPLMRCGRGVSPSYQIPAAQRS